MANRPSACQVLPFVLIAIGVILLLGAAIYLLNPLQEQVGSPVATATQPATNLRVPFPEVRRISLGDAKAAWDTKQAVFVDVRGDPYYSEGHIPGALNIPLDDLSSRAGELEKNAWIITYCT